MALFKLLGHARRAVVIPDAVRSDPRHRPRMGSPSYAMSWWVGDGPRLAGRVAVEPEAVALFATVPSAPTLRVRFAEIVRVALERGVLELVRHVGPPLRIGSLDRPGALRELAERLSEQAAASHEA
jgi:hypothetical protein